MSINVMKALRFAQFEPPSVLRIEEIPIRRSPDSQTADQAIQKR
jgi:hypothetical protein